MLLLYSRSFSRCCQGDLEHQPRVQGRQAEGDSADSGEEGESETEERGQHGRRTQSHRLGHIVSVRRRVDYGRHERPRPPRRRARLFQPAPRAGHVMQP